jgi:hypothetical protein
LPNGQCRVSIAHCQRANTTLPTAHQENGGKSTRKHIVKQKNYNMPHRNTCRHSLGFATARFGKSLGLIRKLMTQFTL